MAKKKSKSSSKFNPGTAILPLFLSNPDFFGGLLDDIGGFVEGLLNPAPKEPAGPTARESRTGLDVGGSKDARAFFEEHVRQQGRRDDLRASVLTRVPTGPTSARLASEPPPSAGTNVTRGGTAGIIAAPESGIFKGARPPGEPVFREPTRFPDALDDVTGALIPGGRIPTESADKLSATSGFGDRAFEVDDRFSSFAVSSGVIPNSRVQDTPNARGGALGEGQGKTGLGPDLRGENMPNINLIQGINDFQIPGGSPAGVFKQIIDEFSARNPSLDVFSLFNTDDSTFLDYDPFDPQDVMDGLRKLVDLYMRESGGDARLAILRFQSGLASFGAPDFGNIGTAPVIDATEDLQGTFGPAFDPRFQTPTTDF